MRIRNRVNPCFLFNILLFGCLFFHPILKAELIDGIAAIVNDDVVLFTDIKPIASSKEEEIRKNIPKEEQQSRISQVRAEALDELVNNCLILQEFKRTGHVIPEAMIDEKVSEIIKLNFENDRKKFIQTLSSLGTSIERYRESLRDKFAVMYMKWSKIKGVTDLEERQMIVKKWISELRSKAFIRIL